ncbi:tripartite tricarboxylate transporter substrate binding protein [Pigmentiphaga kullae]|nr:tripartite tricarboxylate transporter substrate binding protein [Pigmentiphaga kullae]
MLDKNRRGKAMPMRPGDFRRVSRTGMRMIAGGLLALALFAGAAAYYRRVATPVTLIVPYAAGGSMDLSARVLAKQLSEALRRQVVLEFIGGAGGILAVQKVLHAKPDGNTYLYGSGNAVLLSPLQIPGAGFTSHDLVPVAPVSSSHLTLMARADLHAQTMDELIELVRREKRPLMIGTPGASTLHHLLALSMAAQLGGKAEAIPYVKTSTLLQDLGGGRLDLAILALPAATGVDAARGKILGLFSTKRSPLFPGIPTVNENASLRFWVVDPWTGIFAQRGTPPREIAHIKRAMKRVLMSPELSRVQATLGVVSADPKSIDGFDALVAAEAQRFAAMVKH